MYLLKIYSKQHGATVERWRSHIQPQSRGLLAPGLGALCGETCCTLNDSVLFFLSVLYMHLRCVFVAFWLESSVSVSGSLTTPESLFAPLSDG